MVANFNKRMRKRGLQVQSGTNRAKIATALAISQTVILSTPVKTGQARANWFASLGFPIATPSEITDKNGAPSIGRNTTIIAGAIEKLPIYLSNNVRHIRPLNAGSSAQAPAGFVEKAILAGSRAVKKSRIFA